MTNKENMMKNKIGSYQSIFFLLVIGFLLLLIIFQLYNLYENYKEEVLSNDTGKEEYEWSDEMKEDVKQQEDYLNRIMQEAVE